MSMLQWKYSEVPVHDVISLNSNVITETRLGTRSLKWTEVSYIKEYPWVKSRGKWYSAKLSHGKPATEHHYFHCSNYFESKLRFSVCSCLWIWGERTANNTGGAIAYWYRNSVV